MQMKFQSLHDMNTVLARLTRTPGGAGDFQSILQHIGQIALEAFSPDCCVVCAYNPLTGTAIEKPTLVGDEHLGEIWLCNRSEQCDSLLHMSNDGPVCIADLNRHPIYQHHFAAQTAFHAFASLALFTTPREKPLGSITLIFRLTHMFRSAECESLRMFVAQASLLLQETWSSHYYNHTARLGQEVNQHLSTTDELFEILQTYVDSVLDQSHTILLAVHQPQSDLLNIYIREQEKSFVRQAYTNEGACQYVIQAQQPLLIRQASRDNELLPCRILPVKHTLPRESYVFVPLVLRGISLGVLSIQHGQPDAYGPEDLLIFQLLANYLALAVHNMRLYTSLDDLNQTGQLLTRQIESINTVQETVERIQQATQADVVVLYPYDALHQRFLLPTRMAGQLLDPTPYSPYPTRPDDMAVLMLRHPTPIFAKESAALYQELEGDLLTRQGNFREREQVRSTAAIPLKVGEEIVGIIFVNFRQRQRFDATQKLFIEGLALYAAIAIRNTQMFDSLSERRLRELAILQQIDHELNRNLDLDSVLQTLVRLAIEHVEADEGKILFYNERTQMIQAHAVIGYNAENRHKQIFTLNSAKGVTRWVLEHKQPVRIDNVLTDPQWHEIYFQTAVETRSELAVPLLDDEEILGVLNVESKREKAFSEQDQHFLLTLAGQALLAIKKAQAYELEKRLSEERRVLNEISKEITSHLDYDHVFNLLLEKALSLTGSTFGSLHLYDPDNQTLKMVAEQGVSRGLTGLRQTFEQGMVGYAAKTRQWYNVGDIAAPAWKEIYEEFFPDVRSELVVPMLSGNELRGVLNIESSHLNHFDEGHSHLMQELADLAVIALQNAERYDRARSEALRFELLYQAAQELSRITNLEQIEEAYDIILRSAIKQSLSWGKQCRAIIRRYHEDDQELEIVRVSHGYSARHRRTGLLMGINGQVARERRTIVVDDVLKPQAGVDKPQPSDLSTRSLLITPIIFKEYYYGNLALNSQEIGYFQEADRHFFEGLAQQLASTIHRLEILQARLESEQRARAAEIMSDIGQMAFELTHRWDNDLGLVRSYINDIQAEMEALDVSSTRITRKLGQIMQVTRSVLDLSKNLKQGLVQSGESITTDTLSLRQHAATEALVSMYPEKLFTIALHNVIVPPAISVEWEAQEEVGIVRAYRNSVVDILRNLISNAVEAMPNGGSITLRTRVLDNQIALDVSDVGSGIPPQYRMKIFDLFYSTKGSSGFGLWSARKNAIKNGGDLQLTSEVGKGTTFTLLLPRGEGQPESGTY